MPTPEEHGQQPEIQVPQDGPMLEFEHVSIGFEGKPVLEDISFTLEKGQTRVILGPAGVGKSVLLKLADGLLRPDEGTIRLLGIDITQMREKDLLELRRRVGIVFQESALFDSLNVEDNVGYRLFEEKMPEAEVREKVSTALRFVELEHAIDKMPAELSGGMRRRVAIARAMITQPDVLLYDSPTGGLDPITSTTIIELIVKQRDVFHTTSLLVTHRLQDAFLLATRAFNQKTNQLEEMPKNEMDQKTSFLMLNEGKIVFNGTTHDLVTSEDSFIQTYLG